MNIKKFKADLVDIEISALELSEGNYKADEYKSDCEHIATLAYDLRTSLEKEITND